jgi:hypothetical protein
VPRSGVKIVRRFVQNLYSKLFVSQVPIATETSSRPEEYFNDFLNGFSSLFLSKKPLELAIEYVPVGVNQA